MGKCLINGMEWNGLELLDCYIEFEPFPGGEEST